MPRPVSHRVTRLAVAAAAGLALTATPAVATEGTSGPQLPNALAPVTIPPASAPGGPKARSRAARPRVTGARVTPRRVSQGRRSRLRLRLAASARVRVVIERTSRGRHVRVSARTVAAAGSTLSLRLPAHLRAGRYRVTAVAIDAQGTRSRVVRRSLTVVAR